MLAKVMLFCCAALAVCSCQSTFKMTSRVAHIPEKDLNVTPVVCDMVVNFEKKITATSAECESIADAKEAAYYQAIMDNDIDVLIDPIYKATTTGGVVVAVISGYGAVYTNPRPITTVLKELQEIKAEDINKFKVIYLNQKPGSLGCKCPPQDGKSCVILAPVTK